ncbi:MAG TPA: transglutaminase-like domain-containing protein [Opitutaceae bacterium]|nr:transglutaminase-like domain-containing protein [Opitutaceae bacterium]
MIPPSHHRPVEAFPPSPRNGVGWRRLWRAGILSSLLCVRLSALTMDELMNDPKMTPQRFAGLFADFKFVLQPFDVQDPKVFLKTQSGDCIDYAVLADHVLGAKGYETRLIRVEMVGSNIGHAVCYVTESKAYLDYNNRVYFVKLQKCGATIREIAGKVAASFDANWTFAMEFTYNYKEDKKHPVYIVVKTDPPAKDPDLARPPRAAKPSG